MAITAGRCSIKYLVVSIVSNDFSSRNSIITSIITLLWVKLPLVILPHTAELAQQSHQGVIIIIISLI
jgi:hypothetical protein